MKYCKEIVEEICGYIEKGNSHKDAATLCDISQDTFYEWKNTRPEFSEKLKKAEAACKARVISTMQIAAQDVKTWTAAAWWLERKYKDEFAAKPTMVLAQRFDYQTTPEKIANDLKILEAEKISFRLAGPTGDQEGQNSERVRPGGETRKAANG